jgi:hypothetical protein
MLPDLGESTKIGVYQAPVVPRESTSEALKPKAEAAERLRAQTRSSPGAERRPQVGRKHARRRRVEIISFIRSSLASVAGTCST